MRLKKIKIFFIRFIVRIHNYIHFSKQRKLTYTPEKDESVKKKEQNIRIESYNIRNVKIHTKNGR